MKHLLLITAFTIFSLASNPFDTLTQNHTPKSKTIKTKSSKRFYYAYQLALKGNINAQFDVAMMYGTGSNVEKNERKAFTWLHKAAYNGHVEAKYLMGVSFKQGTGVRVQKELARYWFRKAVKAGHTKAIFQLAELEKMFQKGRPTHYASSEF
jgi:TPR repeat protein